MNTKASLAIILTALLLADSLHGVKWQGMGSRMNNTVISEIWNGLVFKVDQALATNSVSDYNAFTKDLSDRLNARWDPAWNVVLTKNRPQYDSVLYGYAFRNQWMWFNGVPNSVLGTTKIATLIVWKDYNCQSWRNIAESSGGTSFNDNEDQNIYAQAHKITDSQLQNDVWLAAHNLVTTLQANTAIYSGAYSVILTQDGTSNIYGYVCRVGNQYFYGIKFTPGNNGLIYVFQTR